MKQSWLLGLLVIVASGLFGLLVLPKLGPSAKAVGRPVAEFSLPLVDLDHAQGSRFSLSGQHGKVVVMDFWASWCGPCFEQAKVLERFALVPRPEVVVVGINEGESIAPVVQHLRRHPASYQIVLDEDQQVGESFRISGLPTLVIVDPKGQLSSISSGVVSYARLERLVADALRN